MLTLRRFGFGFALPWRLLAQAWRAPEVRRRYVRVFALQALALALMFGFWAWTESSTLEDLWRSVERRQLDASARTAVRDLFAALFACEWVVVALSRDFHDALSRDVSLIAALPPEDLDTPPRVRFNWRWVKRKMKRRGQAWVLYGAGLPIVALLAGPFLIFHFEKGYSVLAASWAMYGIVVGVAGKSAYAYSEENAPDPWFVHVLAPLERARITAWYPRLLRKASTRLRSPARAVAQSPAAFAGLTLARAVTAIFPFMYLIVRPIVPVAAAKILQVSGTPLRITPEPVSTKAPKVQPLHAAATSRDFGRIAAPIA